MEVCVRIVTDEEGTSGLWPWHFRKSTGTQEGETKKCRRKEIRDQGILENTGISKEKRKNCGRKEMKTISC